MTVLCSEASIRIRKYSNAIAKELLRKSIHICSAAVPFFLCRWYWTTIAALFVLLITYVISESLRLRGKNVPIISAITAAAARKRDENRFVLGPVTLCSGIILCALLCRTPEAASVGIFALAFGDGIASLMGKLFGNVRIPFTAGKSVVGSLSCFSAIFFATYLFTHSTLTALIIALCGMIIEVIPLKDMDNIAIPVIVGFIYSFMI